MTPWYHLENEEAIGNVNKHIKKAVDIFGGQRPLARMIGSSPTTVHKALHGDRMLGAIYCARIEKFTSGKVTARDLRPDIFNL